MSKVLRPHLMLCLALFTAGMDFFNLGLIFPMVTEMTSDADDLLVFSLLISAFPFGQFIAAPSLGRLSDRFGRRKVLLCTIAGSGLGMAICVVGVQLEQPIVLLIGRLFGGLMGANLTLAYATIADVSDESTKVKNLAWIPISTCIGFVAGPFVVGVMGFGISSVPLWLAVGLCLINWALVLAYFENYQIAREDAAQKKRLVTESYLWIPLIISFLMIGANFLLVQFLGPLANKVHQASVSQVSWLYINCTVSCQLGHVFLTRPLSSVASPKQILPWSLAALAISLVAVSTASSLLWLHIYLAVAMCCCAVAYTNVFAYLSSHVGEDRQGEIMGLGVSVQALAEFLPALLVGFFSQTSTVLSVIVGATGCLVGITLLLLHERATRLSTQKI